MGEGKVDVTGKMEGGYERGRCPGNVYVKRKWFIRRMEKVVEPVRSRSKVGVSSE